MNIIPKPPKVSPVDYRSLKTRTDLFLLCSLVIALSLSSCKKEIGNQDQSDVEAQRIITNDRTWYETFTNGRPQNRSIFQSKMTRATLENPSIDPEKINVNWNLATTVHNNEKTIVEANVKRYKTNT